MKCLIKECPNDSTLGMFIGDLCSPCHEYLKTGKYKPFFIERLGFRKREIDGKFHCYGDIIKTSNDEILPLNEPLFLTRGRDHLAIDSIKHYRFLCVEDRCNEWQLTGVDNVLKRFHEFADKEPSKMKQPGITKGK